MPVTVKLVGSLLIALWSLARLRFWLATRKRAVRRSAMTPARSALLVVVSLSLAPIYLYYFTPLLDRSRLAWPAWIGWLGNALLTGAVALFIWSHLALGPAWTARVDVAEGQRLVTRGPFRWVRHPMYLSLFLLALALLLASASPLVALPFGVALVAMYAERVGAEEALMLETFGEEYRAYMGRTGRLLPRCAWRGRRPRSGWQDGWSP